MIARRTRKQDAGSRKHVSRFLPLAICLLLLAFCLLPPASLAQGAGVVEGQVVNGSAGAPPLPAGLAVTLRAYDGERELPSREATADAEGRFRFEGLQADPALDYEVEVEYLGVPYWSEPLQYAADVALLSTTVTVYETSEDDPGIRLSSVHVIAQSFGQVLRLSEVLLFTNPADRTFIGRPDGASGGRRVTLSIPQPQGAVGLGFPEGEPADRFVETEGGLLDTEPVRPGSGTSLARFSYHLVVSGPTVSVERGYGYPVDDFSLLAVQPGLEVSGPQLQAGEPVSFGDVTYSVYTAQPLPAGGTIRIDFLPRGEASTASGMPTSASAAPEAGTEVAVGQQGVLTWLGLAVVILAAAGVLFYAGRRGEA